MKKRIISLLLVLSMLLCVLPAASATETTAPKFTKYNLTLNKSIAMNFKVPYADVQGKFEKVVFTKNGVNTEITVLPDADADGMAVFTFSDMTPRDLGTEVTATLYTTGNSTSITKSVKAYCESMLAKDSTSGELKTLLVDLLNYGAAFQNYPDTTADKLANADLTPEQQSLATSIDPTLTDDLNKADETGCDVTWASASLALQDSVQIRFDIKATSSDGLTLKVTLGEKTWNVTEFHANGSGVYSAYFDKLNPAQMREVVTAQVYNGETAVSSKLTYSIVSYAHYQTNNEEASDNLKTLVEDMMKYGDATKAWVDSTSGGSTTTPTVASVEILSGNGISVALSEGSTLTVQAVAKDADGNVIEGETLTYSVADESVATVDSNGTLQYATKSAKGGGTTTLTVESNNGKKDTVTVFAARYYTSFDTIRSDKVLPMNWSANAFGDSRSDEYARSGMSWRMTQSSDPRLIGNSTTFHTPDNMGLSGYTVSFWVYDMGETTAFKAAFAGVGGLGVTPSVSEEKYVCYDAAGTAKATDIARSDGWHEFRYVFSTADANSMGTCALYIDGNLAAELPNVVIPFYLAGNKNTITFEATDGKAAPGIYVDDALHALNEKVG